METVQEFTKMIGDGLREEFFKLYSKKIECPYCHKKVQTFGIHQKYCKVKPYFIAKVFYTSS